MRKNWQECRYHYPLMQDETNELARASVAGDMGKGSREPVQEHDLLSAIPSPTRRLWLGLCVTLAIFAIFASYTIREIRGLQDFQVNVVQKNRKDSLQLLGLYDDTYQLAVSLRDMTLPESRYPIYYWKGKFSGLHEDMNQRLALEKQYAQSTPAGDQLRRQLHDVLENFWELSDEAFNLAEQGHEDSARYLIRSQLEEQHQTISSVVSRLLNLNDQAQQEAGQRVILVYRDVSTNILLLIGCSFWWR